MYNPYDFYFQQAKKQGYKARSAFKLEEIQKKYSLITHKTQKVLDIGCAPGSWIQYTLAQLQRFRVKNPSIIGFDIKEVGIKLPGVYTYIQDITQRESVKKIFSQHQVDNFDFIQSDMAPNTIGIKDIDAMRSIDLIDQTYRIYDQYLHPRGSFVIKVFMGPGFEEFVLKLKKRFGGKFIKIFKPDSSRKQSKEIYIIKLPKDQR